MRHSLDGCMLKLQRAETHFRELKQMMEQYMLSSFYEVASEIDRRGRLVARAVNVQMPDAAMSLLVGDCVHNFRSALDHLAYQLACSHTRPLPESHARTSEFPIYLSGTRYRAPRGAATKTRGMSRRARSALERLQPFHRRAHPEQRYLWMLHELSIIDKHRLVHLTAAVPMEGRVTLKGTGALRVSGIEHWNAQITERAILARVYGEFKRPLEVDVQVELAPIVVFDRRNEARSVRGLPLVTVLNGIREVIGFRVFVELEDEIKRAFPDWRLGVRVTHRPVPVPPGFADTDHDEVSELTYGVNLVR